MKGEYARVRAHACVCVCWKGGNVILGKRIKSGDENHRISGRVLKTSTSSLVDLLLVRDRIRAKLSLDDVIYDHADQKTKKEHSDSNASQSTGRVTAVVVRTFYSWKRGRRLGVDGGGGE